MTDSDDLAGKLLATDEKSALLQDNNAPRQNGLLNTQSREFKSGVTNATPLATSGHLDEIKEEEGYKNQKPNLLRKMSSMYSNNSGTRDELKSRLQKQKSFNSEMVKISFRSVNFTVTQNSSREEIRRGEQPTKQLHILKDCTGYCLPGQTTFIMGASGAGKTSLLNLLSDRISIGEGMSVKG